MAPPSKRKTLTNVTVEDADALDCGVCYLPLKPPIFQCAVGHVVCSPCRDKLLHTNKCHVCRAPTSGGYRRNHDMKKLVEAIRVPCPNAAYGCAARPAYYDHGDHIEKCPHPPCYCPADACSFAGSIGALLDHFAVSHEWPCTEIQTYKRTEVHLRDGFHTFNVHSNGKQYLLLLKAERNPFGHAISAFLLHPQVAGNNSSSIFFVRLEYSRYKHVPGGITDMYRSHSQETKFRVACTDLSGGLPNSEDCFQVFLPKPVQPSETDTITVKLTIMPC